MSPANPTDVLKFLHLVENLKTTKRTGWVRSQVNGPESIADHMHRMGILSLLIPEQDAGISRTKIIKMSM
jgi:putative hydrolase of HD superfamily